MDVMNETIENADIVSPHCPFPFRAEDPPKKKSNDESNADKPVPTVNVLEVRQCKQDSALSVFKLSLSISLCV